MKKLIFVATYAYLFALTGCGQTGVLYLPEANEMRSDLSITIPDSSITSE